MSAHKKMSGGYYCERDGCFCCCCCCQVRVHLTDQTARCRWGCIDRRRQRLKDAALFVPADTVYAGWTFVPWPHPFDAMPMTLIESSDATPRSPSGSAPGPSPASDESEPPWNLRAQRE